MLTSRFSTNVFVGLPLILSAFVSTVYGQTPRVYEPANRSVITLDEPLVPEVASTAAGHLSSKSSEKLRQFGSATAGESNEIQTLTLRFAAADKLIRITSTKDFEIQPGGCIEGDVYEAKSTCTVVVRFTPQGPGHRFGKLTVSDSASPTPMSIGLLGEGTAPVVSFTPAQINTVPGTLPSGVGLLDNALSLAVDGGDTLYIADTGNNLIRSVDSSGTIQSVSSVFGTAAPFGITTDSAGQVYFTQRSSDPGSTPDNVQVLGFGGQATEYDDGSNSCAYGTSCALGDQQFSSPGGMATDPYGNVFMNDVNGATRIVPVPDDIFENGIPLYLQYNYPFTGSLPIAVDADDNIYSYYSNDGSCAIFGQSYENAVNIGTNSTKVAGGRTCGFSGDGGQAGSAEIGASVGQFAFDIAGNFYFTDTSNNRVRRIDGATGIIHTIAGNGTAGDTGDSGPAPSARLNAPTGLTVDSQGQVYIISGTASSATSQVIRKMGTNGDLVFSGQLEGTASTAKSVTVSNTGNAQLEITNTEITGTNKGDFSIDPTTTSCLLTPGSTLNGGQSCQIGVIFKPASAGNRTASLTLLDNTVNNSNTVLLSGSGTLPAATIAITAPAARTTVTYGSTVKFAVSVTSSSGAAPTGTVAFSVDGTAFGSPVTIASGAASVNLTGLSVKTHTISAAYSGDANYSAGSASESIIVAAATPTFKITAPAASASFTYGTSVTFTVGVTSSSGTAPTGTVKFSVDGTATGSPVTVASGAASISLTGLSVKAHTISAAYSGDSNYAAASASESITVTVATPTFKITAPAAGASFTSGTTVVFTVSVTSSSGATPTGTVKFSVDGTAFGSPVTVASKAATINLTGLSVKAHTISAAYSGDANYASATASESITVTAATVKSTVRLASMLNPASSNEPISFSARVVAMTGEIPGGSVELFEGKTMLARASLKEGIANFTIEAMTPGSHLVTAEYSGDSKHAPANSILLRQVVK